jgi:nitrogen fixation NifU-like protein
VQLLIEEDRIREIAFMGQGCAISKASCSIMTEAVSGKTVEETLEECRTVIAALTGEGDAEAIAEDSELVALLGVKKFPARLKCATLAWHALQGALSGQSSVCTEDS